MKEILMGEILNICYSSSSIGEWPENLRLRIANSLFNNLHEGICVTDASERIVEVNPTFCKLSGYSRDELLGETPRILGSGLQNHEYYSAMWAGLLAAGEWHGEVWNLNKSGRLFAARLNISAICDPSGEVALYLGIMADITAIKAQQDEWEKSATHDQLTGLPNRILLIDRMQQAMAQSQRTGLVLAICYLDLDGFKPVNDVYGHDTGDLVLVEVSKRLHRSVRDGDTVARVGGDEFVLLLWGLSSMHECDQTLTRVLAEIAHPITIGDAEVSVSASVGVAMFPTSGNTSGVLTAQADSAMYRSKAGGGNRFTYF